MSATMCALDDNKCKDEYIDDYEDYSMSLTAPGESIGVKHHLEQQQQLYISDAEDDELFSRQKSRKLSKYEKCWSGEETEKLIKLWSEQQELYNPSLPAYFDRGRKQLITQEIAEKLETEECSVRKKMKSLQSYYCQLRRRESLNKTSELCASKKPSWPFYDMLEFLNVSSGAKSMSAFPDNTVDEVFIRFSHSHNLSPRDAKDSTSEYSRVQNELMSRSIAASDPGMARGIPASNSYVPRYTTTEGNATRPVTATSENKMPRYTPNSEGNMARPVSASECNTRKNSTNSEINLSRPTTNSEYNKSRPPVAISDPNVVSRPNTLCNEEISAGPNRTFEYNLLKSVRASEGNMNRSEGSMMRTSATCSNIAKANGGHQSEDSIFGELVAKSISKVPDGEIKEELKIEIQQLILAAKRRSSVL